MRLIPSAVAVAYFLLVTQAAAADGPSNRTRAPTVSAELFAGTDVGTKVNTALASLNLLPGTVRVTEPGVIRVSVVIGVGQTVEFGPGDWSCAASPCITVDSSSQVVGSGVFLTRLVLAPTSPGPVIQSRDFAAFSGKPETELLKAAYRLGRDRKVLPGTKYVRLRDFTLDGGGPAEARRPANGIELYGFWSWLENLSIEHFSGHGLITEFVAAHGVSRTGNDVNESYFKNIKFISNTKCGWVNRGPHDSIASGLIAANNGEWGIDVLHKDGFHSGAGLMLSNVHLYGNGGGLRTSPGANIVATNLESEANHGSGLLLRSNDNIIHGLFYANGKHGIEVGSSETHAGANVFTVQLHNNRVSQLAWANSAGFNTVQGSVFAMPGQLHFTGSPTRADLVLVAGNFTPSSAQQYIPGGLQINGGGVLHGSRATSLDHRAPIVLRPKNRVVIDASKGDSFVVELQEPLTESEIQGGHVGQMLTLVVIQGKSGGNTFNWPKNLRAAPPINLAPGSSTVTVRVFDGATWTVAR